MRALQAAVIVMGVLIVVGTVALAVAIANRLGGRSSPPAVVSLAEPEGSRIIGIAGAGDRLAVHIAGGGRPDRILLVDPATRRVVGQILAAEP